MTKRLDIEYVKTLVYEIAGYTLLEDVYVNNNTKMTAIDDYGYKYYFTLSNLKFAGSARMVDKPNPYSIENIKLWLINNDMPYNVLSTEYNGNGSKNRDKCLLELCCENGHVFYRTWNDIIGRDIACDECKKRFNNHEQFISYIDKKYNGEYEVIGKYINSQTKIDVRHNKCGNIFSIKPEHLANGHGCNNPLCCKKRGKEHYRYNDNITDEDRFNTRDLSHEYREWRLSVYRKFNFACDICGCSSTNDNKIVAHHLNSWDEHEDERYDVDNGVVLCQKCHIDFHKKYGYGKNNLSQYIQYKNNHGNTEVICQIS